MICPELGVAPLVDPGTDVEDEWPTPVGSPSPVVDGAVPLSAPSGVDMELAHVFQEICVLPAMVTPVEDPEGGSAMTPARYPVPPIPELLVVVSDPLDAASPARPAVGSPCWPRCRLLDRWLRRFHLRRRRCCGPRLMSVRHRGWQPWTSICHGVLRRRWGSPQIPPCFQLP